MKHDWIISFWQDTLFFTHPEGKFNIFEPGIVHLMFFEHAIKQTEYVIAWAFFYVWLEEISPEGNIFYLIVDNSWRRIYANMDLRLF